MTKHFTNRLLESAYPSAETNPATTLQAAAGMLQTYCHGLAAEAGWWTDLETGHSTRSPNYGPSQGDEKACINIPEKLCLVHSEVSEAMEGARKNRMDEHLPHRMALEVELADAVIRCFDLAGGLGLNLAGALVEKLRYNASREDHKLDNRKAAGGKLF